jgi:hypothetical protein
MGASEIGGGDLMEPLLPRSVPYLYLNFLVQNSQRFDTKVHSDSDNIGFKKLLIDVSDKKGTFANPGLPNYNEF